MDRGTRIRLFGAVTGALVGGFFGWIISSLEFADLSVILAETMFGGLLIGLVCVKGYLGGWVRRDQLIFLGPGFGAVTGLLFGVVNPFFLGWPMGANVTGGAAAGMFIGAISGALVWVYTDETF